MGFNGCNNHKSIANLWLHHQASYIQQCTVCYVKPSNTCMTLLTSGSFSTLVYFWPFVNLFIYHKQKYIPNLKFREFENCCNLILIWRTSKCPCMETITDNLHRTSTFWLDNYALLVASILYEPWSYSSMFLWHWSHCSVSNFTSKLQWTLFSNTTRFM